MNLFEKKQSIEAIKTIVKARWFFALIIFLQGIILNLFLPQIPLPRIPILFFILLTAFFVNFIYWLYLRQPIEKMSDLGVKFLKAAQVFMDFMWVSAILYFSGTVSKMALFLYFITLMVAASLYQKKGIIFFTLFLQSLFTILAFLQYKGLMYSGMPVAKEVFGVEFKEGDRILLIFLLIGFYSYSTATAIFAGYLANFFKQREKKIYERTVELSKKTKELLETKNLLKSALVKSDKSRIESIQIREALEKANKELKEKVEELEKFHRLTIGREIKMIELKKEIKKLKEKIKELEGSLEKE